MGQRTAKTRTFLDPVSGLHVTQVSTAPINFKNADGDWQVIDNKLASDGSGGWRNGTSSYGLSLPQDLSKPVTIASSLDTASWVSVQLAPAKTPVAALPPIPDAGQRPIPEVAATAGKIADPAVPNELTYAKPFTGVDVSYAATGFGVKESTTLGSLDAVDGLPGGSLTYTLRTPSALSATQAGDGSLMVQNAKGGVVFTIPAAFMDDAQGGHSSDVTTTLAADKTLTTDTQNAWTLTLTPNRDWLAAKERVWPVVVDPSVVIGSPSAMKGCTVRSDTPTVNDCAGSEIITSKNGSNERRVLLDFDTFLDVVPADAQMAAAYVNLWMPAATGNPTSSVDIFGSKKPWTTAATWNLYDANSAHTWPTGGDPTGTVYGRYSFTANGQYQSAQVTRLAQDWALGVPRDWGFVMAKTSADTTALSRFGSPSSANPPSLYVEWDARTGVRKNNTAVVDEKLSDRTGVSINPVTGNAKVSTKEFTIAGMGLDLNVTHTSNSLDTGGLGELGYGWTSSLHALSLTPYDDGGSATTVANADSLFYVDGSGAQWTFLRTKTVSTDWIRPKGLDMDLSASGASPVIYTLTDRQSQTKIKFENLGDAAHEKLGVDTITDRNSNQIAFTYDLSARSSLDGRLLLRSVTDTRGRTLTVSNGGSFDSSITESAPSSRSVAYTRNSSTNQMDQFQNTGGGLTAYEYDSAHRVTKVTTPSGGVTQMTYDSTGRIQTLKRVDPVTPANSPLWQFAYTAYNRDSDGKATTKTTVTDPNNHATEYTGNGKGLVQNVKDALGKDAPNTYSPNDDVADATGRTTGTTTAAEKTVYDWTSKSTGDTYRYGGSTLPTGAATSLDYTGTGVNLYNATSSTDEQGNQSDFGYDANGNKNRETRPDGNIEYTLYEGNGDPLYSGVAVHCGPSGAATKGGAVCEKRDGAYAASGTSRAAQSAHRTAYEYNAKGELVTLHPPGGGTLADQTFTYDSLSRKKTVTDGIGAQTTYDYDALDRIIKITHNDGTFEVNDYGGASGDGWQKSLKEYTSGSVLTRTTTYTRDWMGRVTGITSPEGTLAMGYDKAGNMTSYKDNSGPTSSDLTQYGYDAVDHLIWLSMPAGSCSTLSYDSPGTNTNSGCITFKNDDDGRRLGIKYPGGNLVQTYTRDDSGRITQIQAKTGGTSGAEKLKATYSYQGGSPSGDRALIMSSGDTVNAGTTRNTANTYDKLNQLKFANTTTGGMTSEQFCYDPAGNRTLYYRNVTSQASCTTPASPAASYTYNTANQLTAVTGVTPAGATLAGTGFSYNGDGDETSAKSGIGRTSTNGNRGQVTSFTPAGSSAISQGYSSMGNGARVTSGTTTFMPSPLSPAPAWSKTGSTTTWTIRDPDGTLLGIRVGPTTTPASGTTYHPFTDRLGNVRAMTTAAGTVQNVTYLYSAYGYNTATSGSLVQPYKWGQGYTDETTGLIKLGIRYYDPAHGRFTQQDPTGKDKFAYSYGNNCANTYNDPNGTETLSSCSKIVGGGFVGGLVTGAATGFLSGPGILAAATVGAFVGTAGGLATCAYNSLFDLLN